MKNLKYIFFVVALTTVFSCSNEQKADQSSATDNTAATSTGQEGVVDDVSQKDVVKIAVGSKDHTTLVAALKQAEYVSSLSNAGPFTVFAPTNEAFDKLPKGTVDDLMKPENKDKLQNILEYHVSIGVYKTENMTDGQKINQANLKDIVLTVKDGKVVVNGTANIIASIPASNGIIHVIDAVLLPPADK
jgi:uncharacterized surface protein with fasciclin (FAS1) repeats